MDSALRPREIQSRIRAGQSLEEVAEVAGVPTERIEAFAAPVLAEREYVAGLALAATIRRRGEVGAHRSLRAVVAERLTSQRIDPDTVHWDAWRNEDRRWSLQATWTSDEGTHTALFSFDLASKFSTAADDQARWLVSEATELEEASDELAIVRVVTPADDPVGDPDNEPTVDLPDAEAITREAAEEDIFWPRSSATPQEIGEEVEAEIDSYGLISDGRSELDVLYDMLGGLAEDSINIYAGLADPVVPQADEPEEPEQVPPTEPAAPVTPPAAQAATTTQAKVPSPRRKPRSTGRQQPAGELDDDAEPTIVRKLPAAVEPTPPAGLENPSAPEASTSSADTSGEASAGQPKLVDDPEATIPIKPGASKRRRKGRAQVPSWEDIMFGGPKTD